MAASVRRGARRRSRIESVEMARRALNDAALYATVAGGASFVLLLLGRLPFIGVAFGLLHLLVGFAAYVVAGFLVTARLHRFFHGPTRTLLAFHFGLGAATAVAAGIALASLVSGLLLIASDGPGGGQGIVAVTVAILALTARTIGDFFPHLITGTLLAALGGFVAFDRDRLPDEAAELLPRV